MQEQSSDRIHKTSVDGHREALDDSKRVLKKGSDENEYMDLILLFPFHLLLVLHIGQTQWESSSEPRPMMWSLQVNLPRLRAGYRE